MTRFSDLTPGEQGILTAKEDAAKARGFTSTLAEAHHKKMEERKRTDSGKGFKNLMHKGESRAKKESGHVDEYNGMTRGRKRREDPFS